MSYTITLLNPDGTEEDTINVSGDLSNFFEHFGAENVDTGTNGDGSFTASVAGIQNFLKSENKYPHQMSGESILRRSLDEIINYTTASQFTFICS